MRHQRISFLVMLTLVAVLVLLPGSGGVGAQNLPLSSIVDEVTPILADGQFVYGPNVGNFDVEEFLRSLDSPLLPCAAVLADKASYYSVNPRVLLTVLEVQDSLVTGRQENAELARVAEYEDIAKCDERLEVLTKDMVQHFYARLYGSTPSAKTRLALSLSTGEETYLAMNTNAGSLSILATLAPLSSETQWQSLTLTEDRNSFVQTWLRLFPDSDPLDNSNQILAPTAPPADLLKLPFACGDTWYFSGGPHDYDGNCDGGDPWSAVDFAPGGVGCAIPTDRWITSPASGTVSRVDCGGCQVYVDHRDGWGTRFYHVANVQVGGGQPVSQDQHIGNPSCKPASGGSCGGCSGYATGTHVHHDLMYNGAFYSIDGALLEGWGVHSAGCYGGYLQKDSQQVWAGARVASTACSTSPPTISFNAGNPTERQWYNVGQTLSWIISASGSDVRGYKYAWDQSPPGGNEYSGASGSVNLSSAGQGQHTLYVQAWNNAGVPSSVTSTGWFGYDTRAPSNPIAVSSGCDAQNNIWQNTCNDPSFTWSGASDGNGSGIKDYHYYWGDSSIGVPDTYTSSNSFDPHVIAGLVAVRYLRIATRDNLDQESSPSTLFVLRYDTTAPTATLQINKGATTANQVDVTLNLTAADTGSGVAEVCVSNSSSFCSNWQPYAEMIPWSLPALNRRDHTVYVRARDRAGNESALASDTIYLDLYPLMPHSDNYRVCADVINAGGLAGITSASYSLVSSIGQPWATGESDNASANFAGRSGFLADIAGCLPISFTTTSFYTVTQWVMASGGNVRGSASFRLGDTTGQPAASGANVFSSTSFVLSSGFWAGITGTVPSTSTVPPTFVPATPTPTPTPGPTPTPQPGSFGVSINDGAQYTNDPQVVVRVWAPNVTQVRLSNDSDYADQDWRSYQVTTTWVISTSGEYGERRVYAWFKDADGTEYGSYSDDITYDPVAPEGRVTILGSEFVTVTLWLETYDDNSGVDGMRIGENANLTSAAWEPYTNFVTHVLQNPVVYAQFRDRAGNESLIYGSDGSVHWQDSATSRSARLPIEGPGQYDFGQTCARLYLDGAGTLNTVTITLISTYPTAQAIDRSLPRTYEIEGDGTGFAATLSVCYEDSEVAASGVVTESDLQLYRHAGGGYWQPYSSTVDVAANLVTATQVTTFSTWAIGTETHTPTVITLRRLDTRDDRLPWIGALMSAAIACAGGWRARRRRLARRR